MLHDVFRVCTPVLVQLQAGIAEEIVREAHGGEFRLKTVRGLSWHWYEQCYSAREW